MAEKKETSPQVKEAAQTPLTPPVAPSVQTPAPASTTNTEVKPKSSKTLLTVLLVVIVLLLCVIGIAVAFFVGRLNLIKSDFLDKFKDVTDVADDDVADDDVVSPEADDDSAEEVDDDVVDLPSDDDSEEEQPEGSEVESLDGTWNLYTNHDLGFSMRIPKKIWHWHGSMCTWDGDSYRPKGGIVPTKVFEGDNVYISTEYFYKMGGEEADGFNTNFKTCEKTINSVAQIKNDDDYQQTKWTIYIRDIENDAELTEFIKERYGMGCQIGDRTLSDQEGVYDVTIEGDGKPMEETECFLNYATRLKTYPEKKKAASWDLGQSVTFVADEMMSVGYDQEMSDSFRFE